MKKFLILILVMMVTVGMASVMYQNTSGSDIVFNGKLIEASETVVYSHFVYDDALELVNADVEPIILTGNTWDASNASASTPVTHEVTVDLLADTLIEIDVTSGAIEVFFNSTGTIPFDVSDTFEYTLNTKYYNKLFLKASTPTEAEYRITRKF
jgi:hypothetical protein